MSQHYKFEIVTTDGTSRVFADSPFSAVASFMAGYPGQFCPATAIKAVRYEKVTPSDLKHRIEGARAESHFFCRQNMKFSGDTMGNYGVRRHPVVVQTWHGPYLAWELYRKRPVKCGLQASAFFDVQTMRQVFEKR